MGHRNLDLYYREWADHPDLGHVAQRMLVYMAHRASDDAQPPVYFGGWEPLAVAAGMTRGKAAQNTIKASVRRSLRELKIAGAIVASDQAGPGVRENYALTLESTLTYEPEGTGRAIKWRAVERVGSEADGDTSRIAGPDTPCIASGDTPRIPGGDTPHDAMEIQEATERGYDLSPPKETQTNSKESSIESGTSNSSKVTTLRGGGLENDEDEELPITLEEQRNRMMAALREAHPEEFQPTGTDDGIW